MSNAKEIINNTTASVIAPAYSNSSSRMKISCGAISLLKGMLPEMKTIEPYSPMARANASAKPVMIEGSSVGAMILRNVRNRPAPSVAADSSTSRSKLSSTGWSVRTTNGKPLYASAEARAAHLLYFVVKDHPFVDGNKRIGTLLFLEYLWRNGLLMRMDGSLRLTDNAMVALALLIAESEPSQKDLMIRLTLNLLADRTR